MRGVSFKWRAGAAGSLILALLAVWLWFGQKRGGNSAPEAGARTRRPPVQTAAWEPAKESKSEWDGAILAVVTELSKTGEASGRVQALAHLRSLLAGGATNEVSAAIRRFLDSKADAATGQGFKIGAHGALSEAPTLRAYLLDYLGQIDPAAAAEYARTILAAQDSPDEWALALRNLAHGDASPDARTLLEQKTSELLRAEAWQPNPSVGYLEAFDTAVYLGGTNLLPDLANLLRRQDNPALAHAAFLALDRLVINDPANTLSALLAQADLLPGREQTRANYFARADVRDSRQRQVLEAYLLDNRTAGAELAQFTGLFPSANFMISQNLLTPTPTPDHAALVERDAASLRAVEAWLQDPRFAKRLPELQRMKARIEGFVRQAGGQ